MFELQLPEFIAKAMGGSGLLGVEVHKHLDNAQGRKAVFRCKPLCYIKNCLHPRTVFWNGKLHASLLYSEKGSPFSKDCIAFEKLIMSCLYKVKSKKELNQHWLVGPAVTVNSRHRQRVKNLTKSKLACFKEAKIDWLHDPKENTISLC